MELNDTTQQERRDWYLNAVIELSKIALEKGELEFFVDASLRQVSWVAVTRNNIPRVVASIFAKLSDQVLCDVLYFEEQAERDAQPVH